MALINSCIGTNGYITFSVRLTNVDKVLIVQNGNNGEEQYIKVMFASSLLYCAFVFLCVNALAKEFNEQMARLAAFEASSLSLNNDVHTRSNELKIDDSIYKRLLFKKKKKKDESFKILIQ